MSEQLANRFVDALGTLESSGDVEPLVELFADDGEVGNVVAPEKFTGPEGARDFWRKYRDTFGEVRSTFRNRIVADGRVALEWTTEGTTNGGHPIRYDGVSLLEIEADRITRFRAYFDAGGLGRQMEAKDPPAEPAAAATNDAPR